MVEKPVAYFMTVDHREANTVRSINYTGGQHARCIAIYMRTIHRITWWLFHVEMSVRRAVQQALTPSKRKDGRLWKENRRLLSRSGENVC